MARRDVPPIAVFLVASFGLHGAGVYALRVRPPGEAPAAPVFDPTSQGLTGDTLDVEPAPAEPVDIDEVPSEPSPSPRSAAAPHALPAPSVAHGATAAPASSGGTPAVATPPALFGAVGVRSASDLATTFTRAFPQAASADPIWTEAAFGSTSTAEVTLVLDDDGHLLRSTVSGSPSAALRRGIERTLVLLGPTRPFTARGGVTKIRLTCRVSRNDVHDGLHGDVFALSGGSFSGEVGTAFFALPPTTGSGRRIDVELRLLP